MIPVNRRTPSHRSNIPSHKRKISKTQTSKYIKISFLILLNDIKIGLNMEEIPSTRRTLVIFDPIIFPIAIFDLLNNAAFKLTPSSGREVPNATMVSPITNLEIFNLEAMWMDDFIIQSAPKYNNTDPISRYRILIIIKNTNYTYLLFPILGALPYIVLFCFPSTVDEY